MWCRSPVIEQPAPSEFLAPNTRTAAGRLPSIDVARGLIMVVMALDHASMLWNSGRALPEFALANFPLTEYPDGWQQFTREITHICAPGFQLLAGLGLALSVRRRRAARRSERGISGDMLLRAAVLFLCEWVLLFPVYDGVPFMFVVLCCIGSSMAIFSVARLLPMALMLAVSLALLLLTPLYTPNIVVEASAASYLRNVWTNVSVTLLGTTRACWVIYPIFPWIGFFGVGWWLAQGYDVPEKRRPARLLVMGGLLFLIGVGLRWFGGSFGDRMPGGASGPTTAAFWALAKYPPSPAFSMITLGANLIMLGVLRRLDFAQVTPWPFRAMAVYGRVALFFFIIHFYLYGIYPYLAENRQQFSLATTYVVWLAGLVVLWPLCLGYGKLRARFSAVLRYF